MPAGASDDPRYLLLDPHHYSHTPYRGAHAHCRQRCLRRFCKFTKTKRNYLLTNNQNFNPRIYREIAALVHFHSKRRLLVRVLQVNVLSTNSRLFSSATAQQRFASEQSKITNAARYQSS